MTREAGPPSPSGPGLKWRKLSHEEIANDLLQKSCSIVFQAAQHLADEGWTFDEINAVLPKLVAAAEKWRKDRLRMLTARVVSEEVH